MTTQTLGTKAAKRSTAPSKSNVIRSIPKPSAEKLRSRLVLTQPQFARLLSVSVRSVATLEAGAAPSEAILRRLKEIERLTDALGEVIREESLGKWLQTPNSAFDGSKPLELIERGEADRLWEMIHLLRSGVPF